MKKLKYDIKELGFVPPIYGGVSVSIARLIDKLTLDGYKVGAFYTKENDNAQIINSELYERELNLSTQKILVRLPKCLRILRKYKILHSHYSLENMIYMWCFVTILRKKMVITVHNSMVTNFYRECDPINRFFLKLVARRRDVNWIAVSEQGKERLLNLPIHIRGPIHVIPAYIPDTTVELGELPSALAQYINKHDKIITFYGHSFMLDGGRDVYGFVDALELYANIKMTKEFHVGFVLCLSDDKELQKIELLHNKARELGIDKDIYWQIGAISKMNALWQKTDVYIRPTSTDGDSVAVREALDLGVQVVASDVSPRPNRCVTYEYGNTRNFLSKVKDSLKKGHTEANPDFSNYERIKAIYQNLLTECK